MEQTIAFFLGVSLVLVLAGVIYMFKNHKQVSDLSEELEEAHTMITDLEHDLNSRVDMAEAELENIESSLMNSIDKFYENNEALIEDLHKYVDSRTDKLEARIDAKLNDNTAFVDKLFYQISEIKK